MTYKLRDITFLFLRTVINEGKGTDEIDGPRERIKVRQGKTDVMKPT